jgi:hypothetical protein
VVLLVAAMLRTKMRVVLVTLAPLLGLQPSGLWPPSSVDPQSQQLQSIITLEGQKAWRNKCLGEAKLQPVNPTSPPCLFRQATAGRGLSCDVVDGEFESLDWEGRLSLALIRI